MGLMRNFNCWQGSAGWWKMPNRSCEIVFRDQVPCSSLIVSWSEKYEEATGFGWSIFCNALSKSSLGDEDYVDACLQRPTDNAFCCWFRSVRRWRLSHQTLAWLAHYSPISAPLASVKLVSLSVSQSVCLSVRRAFDNGRCQPLHFQWEMMEWNKKNPPDFKMMELERLLLDLSSANDSTVRHLQEKLLLDLKHVYEHSLRKLPPVIITMTSPKYSSYSSRQSVMSCKWAITIIGAKFSLLAFAY